MSITKAQNLNDAIYTAINNSIGSNNPSGQLLEIYELQGPDNATLPNCTYQIITDVVSPGLSKSVYEDVDIQVNFYGYKKYGSKALRTISDELFSELDRAVLQVGDIGATVQGKIQNVTTVEDDGKIINIRQEYHVLIV